MRNIAVLGSTGSIGTQSLDVIRLMPDSCRVLSLCAGKNAELALRQAEEFRPEVLCVEDETAAGTIKDRMPDGVRLYCGSDAGSVAVSVNGVDTVINGLSGFAGTLPLVRALEEGKRVALANKESIICARELTYDAIARGGGEIIPVDSEQSALFQCLAAGKRKDVKRLILTASGGPFRTYTPEMLEKVTYEDAMKHPTWRMGGKVTLDSATLMNKGLEIIEAAHLFSFSADEITAIIHPQSIVHSLVEYKDSSIIAQLSAPDMRLAIHYALTYPKRCESAWGHLELADSPAITFEKVDDSRFPGIGYAYEALRMGGAAPCVFSGANEEAGKLFMNGEIGFSDISKLVRKALERFTQFKIDSIDAVFAADEEARAIVREEKKKL